MKNSDCERSPTNYLFCLGSNAHRISRVLGSDLNKTKFILSSHHCLNPSVFRMTMHSYLRWGNFYKHPFYSDSGLSLHNTSVFLDHVWYILLVFGVLLFFDRSPVEEQQCQMQAIGIKLGLGISEKWTDRIKLCILAKMYFTSIYAIAAASYKVLEKYALKVCTRVYHKSVVKTS